MGPQETMVEFRLNAKTVTEAFSLYDAALVAMQPEIQEQVNQQIAAQRLRGGPGGPPGGILRG